MLLSRLFDMIGKIWRAPVSEKLMIVEAVWELLRARWRVKYGKFSRWRSHLGAVQALPQQSGGGEVDIAPDTLARAKRLGRIVRAVARRMPFRANCLPQAAAAQLMLQRRGIQTGRLYIGAKKVGDETPLKMHAWLFVGPVCVTGDRRSRDLAGFKPLMMLSFDEATAA